MKNRRAAALLGVLLGAGFLLPTHDAEAQRVDLVSRTSLRVCADPANMPFSNDKGQGFENKIAEIVAAELKVEVEYTWFPQATGFIRQTLFAKRCDVVIGYAQGDELVLNTNHYYRSIYALVYRAGTGLDGVDTLADPRLRAKRIGVVAGTPPASVMAKLDLIRNAKPYPLVVDRRHESPGERMIGDIRSGDIDAGVLWGPMAGYFAANDGEKLNVVPLLKDAGGCAHGLPHHLRRAPARGRLEASAQRADRQAAGRYRRRVAAIRRAAARRAIQSHFCAQALSQQLSVTPSPRLRGEGRGGDKLQHGRMWLPLTLALSP